MKWIRRLAGFLAIVMLALSTSACVIRPLWWGGHGDHGDRGGYERERSYGHSDRYR